MTEGSHRKLVVILMVRSLKVTLSKSWEDVTNKAPNQINKDFQVGESVLMRPSGERKAPYVARVQRFVGDAKGNVNAIVEWYYRPEETIA
nr:bromo adjacent homology (BAH) domain, zinc finger, RING/FYVE/PHD-type [Tanacetum cinerariifolium]